MAIVEKVSDITISNVADYMRVADPNENEIGTYLNIAKDYISNYTGIPKTSNDKGAETLDSYSDFVIVVYILCQDMYDNRTLYVDKANLNKVVQTILDMHCRVQL